MPGMVHNGGARAAVPGDQGETGESWWSSINRAAARARHDLGRDTLRRTCPRVVVAAARAGALGVLDLGACSARARESLAMVACRTTAAVGVRVSSRCPLDLGDLPEVVGTVVVDDPALVERWRRDRWRVVAEVRSLDEAHTALAGGADGLVLGAESGGRRDHGCVRAGPAGAGRRRRAGVGAGGHRPAHGRGGDRRWCHRGGGRRPDGPVARVGATRAVRVAIAAMDGSETRVVAGHRIFTRPDLWVAGLGARTGADGLAGRLGASSLDDQALPAGQDAALAAGFATRYGAVGAMVSGLRREIADHVDAARRADPWRRARAWPLRWAPATPWCRGP